MPKKVVKAKEVSVTTQEQTVQESTLHEELVEINAILKHMLEVLKDIEYNTHDRTGFCKGRR